MNRRKGEEGVRKHVRVEGKKERKEEIKARTRNGIGERKGRGKKKIGNIQKEGKNEKNGGKKRTR